jgi:hypothetical protein
VQVSLEREGAATSHGRAARGTVSALYRQLRAKL